MQEMFCFQCQQTAHNTGCDGKAGVCGKKADTANYQDEVIGALIGLAQAVQAGTATDRTDEPPSAPPTLRIMIWPSFGRQGRTFGR